MFRWDPFQHRRKEDSTVKALRAETSEADLLWKSAERLRNKGVMHPTAEDLTAQFVSK